QALLARTLEVVQTIRFHGNQNFVAIRDVVPAHDPRPSFGASLPSLPLPEPQRSMTSRGYDPRQSPGLGYKRVVSCKDSFHGTDVLAVSEHGAPGGGARTSTRTSSVAKGRTASIHCRPAPPRQTEALSSRTSRSRPLKTSQPSGARAKNERSESVQGSSPRETIERHAASENPLRATTVNGFAKLGTAPVGSPTIVERRPSDVKIPPLRLE